MRISTLLACVLAVASTGCATDRAVEGTEGTGSAVIGELRDLAGRSVGTASVTQDGDALKVRVVATDLPPGVHGIHLHAIGTCDGPDFSSAGAHWNPTDRMHGSQNPQGPHRGDLPNLLVGTNGDGTLDYVIPAGRLGGGSRALIDGDGAAAVVHAAADD
jgi:superoxide dismutase, Cu-Zn family